MEKSMCFLALSTHTEEILHTKTSFAPSTLKGMIMSQWDYGLDPPM